MMEIGILCNNNSHNGEMSDCLTELGMRNNNDATNRNLESMRNSLIDVEQRLKAQRAVAGRSYDLDSMTPEQLMQEKVDLQSALLQFEHLFGHPESVEEKALVKDVYDRYRSVKRYVRRSSSIRSKDPLELETIPEDLEMKVTDLVIQKQSIDSTGSALVQCPDHDYELIGCWVYIGDADQWDAFIMYDDLDPKGYPDCSCYCQHIENSYSCSQVGGECRAQCAKFGTNWADIANGYESSSSSGGAEASSSAHV